MHLKLSESFSLAKSKQKKSSQVEEIRNKSKCYFQTALYKTQSQSWAASELLDPTKPNHFTNGEKTLNLPRMFDIIKM